MEEQPVAPAQEPRLHMSREHVSDTLTVVTVVSDMIDVYQVYALRDELLDLIEHQHVQILIEASALEGSDSTGLAVLVGLQRRAVSSGGLIGIAAPHIYLLKSLRITGLTKLFPVFSTLAQGEELLPPVAAALRERRATRSPKTRRTA
ncbi:STAS domain-containing protein [Streptomyces boluensis]|uniref:STAS domain-containing protein n=1 Tax=Streptomyces boluensis TaxID=1775135 RepID=A0A964USJ4_9ACTN|nr:STAS domain-containing protein [Streptomyces boluensis]NBE54536.1 STAS domain-containing protein [Streptomyces boluensis]